MKRILLTSVMVFLLWSKGTLRAQDFHLSMYDAGPLFLNPAMTGLVDAPWRLHAQYRNQWKAVAYKPFNTALISFDMPYRKWGFGAQVIEMRAGIGNYNVFQFMGSAAYTIPLDKNKDHQLSLAIQAGFTQKSIDFNQLTFSKQYTTTGGGGFDKSIASGESTDSRSQMMEQVNAGALYYYAKETSRINPFVGFSAFNLSQPKETFYNMTNHLPLRTYLHTGIRINFSEKFFILPKVLLMNQKNAREQTYAADFSYYLINNELFLLGGYTYRHRDASVVSLGIRKSNYIAKVAYDINTSTLKEASKNRGAFEISFTYMGKKPKPQTIRNCPRI